MEKKRMYKKFLHFMGILTTLTLVAVVLSIPKTVSADTKNQALDVTFVIDNSASMQSNDPNHMAGEAYKAFVDILPEEGTKVGAVNFSGDVLNTMPLTVFTGANQDQLKQFVTSIHQDQANTNIPAGLDAAAKMLNEANDGNKKAIIFVTDGENDLAGSQATAEDNQTLAPLLQSVESQKIPIYGIGIGQASADYINGISKATGGTAYFPKSAADLTSMFQQIASQLLGTTNVVSGENSTTVEVNSDGFTTVSRRIPQGVLQANIQVTGQQNALITQIIAPDKKDITNDKSKVKLSNETYQTSAIMKNPDAGSYQFKIKSSNGSTKVVVSWIYSYNVKASLTQSGNTLTAVLTDNGKKITDSDTYKDFTGKLYVTGEKSGKSMALSGGNKFTATTKASKGTAYAEISLKNSTFTATSNKLNLDKTSSAQKGKSFPIWIVIVIVAVVVIGAVLVFLMKSKQRKLSGYLKIKLSDGKDTRVKLPGKNKVTLGQLLSAYQKQNSDFFETFKGSKWETIEIIPKTSGGSGIEINTGKTMLLTKTGKPLGANYDSPLTISKDNSHKLTIEFSQF